MNVELHIERLVLEGLPLSRHQSVALQNALEREVGRLLADRGVAAFTGGAVPHLPIAAIQLSAGGQPAQWGRQIAHTLCNGIAKSPTNRVQPHNLSGGSTPPPLSGQPRAH